MRRIKFSWIYFFFRLFINDLPFQKGLPKSIMEFSLCGVNRGFLFPLGNVNDMV